MKYYELPHKCVVPNAKFLNLASGVVKGGKMRERDAVLEQQTGVSGLRSLRRMIETYDVTPVGKC